jgi:hypothetical protein
MKPKIKLLFTAFLCSISSVLNAQSVNIHTAKAIAEHHLAAISRPSLKSTASKGKNFQFTSVKVAVENKDTLYYILNDTINKGFAIVSADKRAWPILGFSTEGSFNEKKQPKALIAWMDCKRKEIEYIKKHNLQPDSTTLALWQNLSFENASATSTSVEPLLNTKWDQGCYYNQLCPSDTQSPYCGHTPTGCVVTALAQIMKYWNYPTKGKGSNSYIHPKYGSISADFGSTTYLWDQMPNELTGYNEAVATLMFHCGAALSMNYDTFESRPINSEVNSIVKYFDFSPNAQFVYQSESWSDLFRNELDAGHPVFMVSCAINHAFVCDGYMDGDLFHFNFGWGGSCDGYYSITQTGLVSGDTFSGPVTSIIIGLFPNQLPDNYNGLYLSTSEINFYLNTSDQVDIFSNTNWTASSNQPWLTVSNKSGNSGKSSLMFSATKNESGKDREALLTITNNGFSTKIVKIRQHRNYIKTITAGGLQDALSGDLSSVTSLAIKGTIDARDFKIMRDQIPRLVQVDLSESTILAYSGTKGTSIKSGIISYQANAVPEFAFYNNNGQGNKTLISIVLPSNTIAIGNDALECCALTSLSFPASVTSIGQNAFAFCYKLASITVDPNNSIYSSDNGVLLNKLQTKLIRCPYAKSGSYSIPSTVKSIDDEAFENCSSLTSLSIPASVTSIGHNAFTFCYQLIAITVDPLNTSYSSTDDVLFNKLQTELIRYPYAKSGSYSIPSTVKTINDKAFEYCNLLTSIRIPASVSSIGRDVFDFCHQLTSIIVDTLNSSYSSDNGVLFNKLKTELIRCPLSKLGSYSVPSMVEFIDDRAFIDCVLISSINLPASLQIIGDAFTGCNELNSINLPASLLLIRSYAFGSCPKLKSLRSSSNNPLDLNGLNSYNVFNGINKDSCTLYVPYGSKSAYQTANQWKEFKNIVEMPGFKLSATTASVKAAQGSTALIDIFSNAACTVNCDKTWLAVSSATGNGTSTLTFTAAENPGNAIRSATVTVSATGVESQIITVTQEAKNTTRIEQLSINPEFRIYPNPTTGKLKLVFDKVPVAGISVTVNDITGKNCFKQLIREKESWIDLSGYVPGIYLIKTDQENLKIQKVILK